MKTAVVFYSMSGNVRQTAEIIAAKLGADLIEIKPGKSYPDKGFKKFLWGGKSAVMGECPKLMPYDFDSDRYDAVIIGFPVWASTFAPPIRSFAEDNSDRLRGKRISAFACMSGSGGEKAISKLRTLLGIDGFEAEMILIDPKDKPKDSDIAKIEAFCKKIKTAFC
ncbi:MAG: flavodoxin family protein [Ruminococcaceae bacterium]|nr:flavodoxin family protein [Oscillospiraceae bacterium]